MYEYAIKEVVKVVDGDTVDIIIDLGFSLSKKERVRLAGIDAPESRTTDIEEKKNSKYLIIELLCKKANSNMVKAIPDLTPEAYKFTIFGEVKSIISRGKKYIK